MVLVLYILALAALFGLYFLLKRVFGEKPEYVVRAPGWELEEINKSSSEYKRMSKHLFQTESGEVIDPNRYSAYVVTGESMSICNIHDGDMVFVENMALDSCSSPKTTLEPNNIVVLDVEDSKRCKIRKIDEINIDIISTSYYKNGNKVPSSKPYSISQVKGVVRYVFSTQSSS